MYVCARNSSDKEVLRGGKQGDPPSSGMDGEWDWVKKIMATAASGSEAAAGSARKSDRVCVVEGLPPLIGSMVDRIEKREFVEFTEFPVFDGTRKPGEWGSERVSPTDKGGSPSKDAKRKGPREVPDVSWWGTCFSLYERVWVRNKPEVADALCAYREAIAGMARKHPWDYIARYDRAFRMKAAGNSDVAWSKVDAALLVNEIAARTWALGGQSGSASRVGSGYPSGNGPRRVRKATVGVCRWFIAEGHCGYGHSCKFRHICFTCGGGHPAAVCGGSNKPGQGGSAPGH